MLIGEKNSIFKYKNSLRKHILLFFSIFFFQLKINRTENNKNKFYRNIFHKIS